MACIKQFMLSGSWKKCRALFTLAFPSLLSTILVFLVLRIGSFAVIFMPSKTLEPWWNPKGVNVISKDSLGSQNGSVILVMAMLRKETVTLVGTEPYLFFIFSIARYSWWAPPKQIFTQCLIWWGIWRVQN